MSVYFHLMTDDMPPERIKSHVPYVTEEEALKEAAKEAAGRGRAIQIFRVVHGEVTSQPWRVVDPPSKGSGSGSESN